MVRCIGQIDGQMTRGGILSQTGASGGLIDTHDSGALTGESRLENIHNLVRPNEAMLQDQQGGDGERQALGDPKAEKDLRE